MSGYTREELVDWNKQELVSFANKMFGLNVSNRNNKEEIADLIIKAQNKMLGNKEVTIVDEDDTTKVKPGYIKVRIQPGKYNPKNRPIFVSHNFRPATIPVNVDVVIPAYYESCLKDAVQSSYYYDRDAGELRYQEENSYPYSVLERG